MYAIGHQPRQAGRSGDGSSPHARRCCGSEPRLIAPTAKTIASSDQGTGNKWLPSVNANAGTATAQQIEGQLLPRDRQHRRGEQRERKAQRQEAQRTVLPHCGVTRPRCAPSVGEHDERREEKVELLLDAEAPCVREGIVLEARDALVPVTVGLGGEEVVRPTEQRELAAEVVLLQHVHFRRHDGGDGDGRDEHEREEGGHEPFHPPGVERHEEGAEIVGWAAQQRTGNYKARDYKEDVDLS
eukprot:7386317-Prymnesium_polylepis.2